MVVLLLSLTAAYLIGSVNFAILLFRILGKDDPRKHFSGNVGATNIYRQAGMFWAAVVLILDVCRAMAVALIAMTLVSSQYVPVIGFALILGNHFPCFHEFKGGKGVANFLGFTLPVAPAFAGLSALTWVSIFALVKTPFLGSFGMIAVLSLGMMFECRWHPVAIAGTAALSGLIVFSHKKNISQFLDKISSR
jgi:glycerol-3-phosphate acyltransferase PlsY